MKPTSDQLTANELERVHGNADFGPNQTPRQVVEESLKKIVVGYIVRHTAMCILREHKLISKPHRRRTPNLTEKGRKYLRAMLQEGRLYK